MIRKKKKSTLPEIQMTSMPDIIFMLLFFFMVVTVLRKKDTVDSVTVPVVEFAELLDREEILPVLVSKLNEHYRYQLREKSFYELSKLEKALTEERVSTGPLKIKLVADKSIDMSTINKVKQLLQKTQFNKVEYLVLSK